MEEAMHPVRIPDEVAARIVKRRGRLHIFDEITPNNTALVVIDMQNAFVEEGMANEIPVAREIVPNINRLARALREAGGTVVWVQMALAGEEGLRWEHFFQHIVGGDFADRLREELRQDGHGFALWPALEPVPGDLWVMKNRFSVFIQGASDLEERLRAQGIDTVLIAGTVTNVCCESSGRDAMMRDFKTILLSDANAARSDEEHLASLVSFAQVFGDVRSTDEAIGLLAGAAPRATPRAT